jgi:zinc protease
VKAPDPTGQKVAAATTEPQLTTLPGGLRLLTTSMPESPVVAVHLWFDVGSVDEPPGLEGAAHFVEHLVFKGTERRQVGEAASEIEALGGDLNAWTSWDETCLHATLDATAAADAIDVLLDMARHSTFDATELEREKQVVIEEIRGYTEDPESVAGDLLHARLFGEHPYGRPILGTPASVAAFDRERLVAFWREHYHPSRAILSVAGPVDHARIAQFVAPKVARWPKGAARRPIPVAKTSPEPGWARPKERFGSVVVALGWPGPAFGHPDLPALYVAWMALANASSSRLGNVLELELGVASHLSAEPHGLVGGGSSSLSFLCGRTAEALAETRAVLDEAHTRGLPRSEVVRAREGLLADLRFSRETTEGVSSDHTFWLARTGDPAGTRAFVRAVAAVEPDDVARVTERWLDPDRSVRVVVDPELDRRALDRAWTPRPRAARPATGPGPARVAGVPVHVATDRGDIAAIEIVGVGGALAERPSSAGTADAWSRMLGRGAGPWDARLLAERCDAVGVSLEATSGRSMFGLHASFPVEELDGAVEILGQLLVDPHFDEGDLHNVREEMLDDLAARTDRPATVGQEALLACLFPEHPWRLPPLGTEASLKALQPSALLHRHRRQVRTGNLAIGVAGGVDGDRARDALAPWLDRLERRGRAEPPVVPPVGGPPVEGVTVRAGGDQATVLAGVRAFAVDDDDRTVTWVVGGLLDSQSGRLFLSLREQRGLAYGVWARSDAGFGAGSFTVGVSTDPARADEARAGVLAELQRLCHQPVPEAELAKVRRMLLGLEAMRLQRVSGRAADLARCARTGQTPGRAALAARLEAVTPARVLEVCRRLRLDAPTLVTVLPEEGRGRRR